jgi:phosphoribosylanthranilate isomerase
MKIRVKICCIKTMDEARMAIRYGASAVGLVSAMPSGPGPIHEELIAEIAAVIPPGVSSFLLTCKQDADAILTQQQRTGVNTIQLVDKVTIDALRQLRKALPGISLVQVVHVCDESSISEAQTIAPSVNAILLDSGNPNLKVKELGGTGRTHNWEISRRICSTVAVPVFLAGGIKPGNIREALEKVQPYGVDVCTGVRTDDTLDEKKLAHLFQEIQAWERLERR